MEYSTGQLGKETGVNIETIRYYERIGVVPKPPRSANGYRVYGNRHLQRLRFVKRSRELGFTLGEVRALLDLVDGGFTCGEVRELTLSHLTNVREKIRDLQRMEQTLKDTADLCVDGLSPDCPIVEVLNG